MSALPIALSPQARADLAAVAPALRPAVLEHLSRLASNYETCSRRTAHPRPPGMESGMWVRSASAATLLEVLFTIELKPDRIAIRRVLITETDRVPDWVIRPEEWGAYPPWPIVDL